MAKIVAAGSIALTSCSTSGLQRLPVGVPSLAQGDELYRHVLDHVVDDRAQIVGALLIDPRPLLSSPAIADVTAADLASTNTSDIARRVEITLDMGLDTTSSLTWRGCGFLLPGRQPSTDCPADPVTVVVVGPARSGGAYFPGTARDDRESGVINGHDSVRIIYLTLGRFGRMVVAVDLVLQQTPTGWETVEKVPLVIIE